MQFPLRHSFVALSLMLLSAGLLRSANMQGALIRNFPDVASSTPEGFAIETLAGFGVISGYPDGTFRGSNLVGRHEAAKILMRASRKPLTSYFNRGRFTDVKDGEWYVPYVLTTAELGIVEGYANKTFEPQGNINTAEFLKMIALTFGLPENLPYTFTDVPGTEWFAKYAGAAEKWHLFPRRGTTLLPAQELTRTEIAFAIFAVLAQPQGRAMVNGGEWAIQYPTVAQKTTPPPVPVAATPTSASPMHGAAPIPKSEPGGGDFTQYVYPGPLKSTPQEGARLCPGQAQCVARYGCRYLHSYYDNRGCLLTCGELVCEGDNPFARFQSSKSVAYEKDTRRGCVEIFCSMKDGCKRVGQEFNADGCQVSCGQFVCGTQSSSQSSVASASSASAASSQPVSHSSASSAGGTAGTGFRERTLSIAASVVEAVDVNHDGVYEVATEHGIVNGQAFEQHDTIQSLKAGDADGDGDQDIVAAILNRDGDFMTTKFAWYENTASRFERHALHILETDTMVLWTAPYPHFRLFDFDGNGKLDILAHDWSGLAKILNPWVGTTDSIDIFDTDVGAISDKPWKGKFVVAEGHLGDAKMRTTKPNAAVLERSGFTRNIVAADIDDDGINDVITGFDVASEVKIFWWSGCDGRRREIGSLGNVNVSGGEFIFFMGAEDLDGDGDGDVVVATANLNQEKYAEELAWWEQTGGGFQKHSVSENPELRARDILIRDFTGDGRPDIVTGGGAVRLFENLSTADRSAFTRPPTKTCTL